MWNYMQVFCRKHGVGMCLLIDEFKNVAYDLKT
jgi:hypothetical protein